MGGGPFFFVKTLAKTADLMTEGGGGSLALTHVLGPMS